MVKAIIFDCFGVLTTDTWLAFVDSLPDGIDLEEIHRVHRRYTAGMVTKGEYAKQIQALSGSSFIETEDQPGSDITKNAALLDYIRKLRERGYKIGLLSNIASSWITDSFLTIEEQKLFDGMILSFRVGMVKPDPRIFRLACERLGVEPRETVLVDDIDRYCVAARSEGMQTVLYESFRQTRTELENILAEKS